ncbi:MAG: ABC transporter ATP-binding protein, partial [Clostridia bacterium]|nr:ABC transporter ATP-binding protein [Clostridia bacterium]
MSKNKDLKIKTQITDETATQPKMSKKAKFAIIRRVSKYLFAHANMVVFCFIIMLVSNILALVAPKLSEKAINAIEPGVGSVDIPFVLKYCALMLLCYVVSAALSYLLSILMVKLSQKIVYSMRRDLFNHLTELPVGYFDTHATGEIISRISYDIDTINTSLSHDLLQIGAS